MKTPLHKKSSSTASLKDVQRWMARAVMRPLASSDRMKSRWFDGSPTEKHVARIIRPNDRLSASERLEIYNRQYWFRVLDSFYEDFPGVRSVLGDKSFARFAQHYLESCPSRSYTLRNLGSQLESYLKKNRHWGGRHHAFLVEVARFEWAQIEAFDAAEFTPVTTEVLATMDPLRSKLGVQSHVQLLELNYPVDDFLLGLKRHDPVRMEVSNAVEGSRRVSRGKQIHVPPKEPSLVAIHRVAFRIYYKRLDPVGYSILQALRQGRTLSHACARAAREHSTHSNLVACIQDSFRFWSQLGWLYPLENHTP